MGHGNVQSTQHCILQVLGKGHPLELHSHITHRHVPEVTNNGHLPGSLQPTTLCVKPCSPGPKCIGVRGSKPTFEIHFLHRGIGDDSKPSTVAVRPSGGWTLELQAALHVGIAEGPGQCQDASSPPCAPHVSHQRGPGVGVLRLDSQPLLLPADGVILKPGGVDLAHGPCQYLTQCHPFLGPSCKFTHSHA